MKLEEGASYNERLFGKGLRARIHFSRFRALANVVREYGIPARRVVELGCYDGKTIRFLPHEPERYLGLDANWESGLDIARQTWVGRPNYSFLECSTPDEVPAGEVFDLAVCMETLEHVPPSLVDAYLARLASITDGYAFISVPNEKGIVFATKYLLKKLVIGDAPDYTLREFLNASVGNMRAVARDEHKGFDYDELVTAVSRHFDVLSVRSIPMERLHRSLGFGVAIVARSRRSPLVARSSA